MQTVQFRPERTNFHMQPKLRIAIIGGGPTGLLMFRRLTETGHTNFTVDIFERKQQLGAGMPYSSEGALEEHVTNVSGNEIPEMVSSVDDWIVGQRSFAAEQFDVDVDHFNQYKVLPRLLFGKYLSDQFGILLSIAQQKGLEVNVHYGQEVTNIIDDADMRKTMVSTADRTVFFDKVIICTGHLWPKKLEGKFKNCFDSPYPPSKIAHRTNHPVALRGSSLTAIDAIRTLARHNGIFVKDEAGNLRYQLDDESVQFRIIMHSRNGLLPAVRFHLEDSHLSKDTILPAEEIAHVRAQNQGFLPLDYVYQRNFLDGIKSRHPMFYELIKELSMERFVEMMMFQRERTSAFELLEEEMEQASQSIANREPIHWKEMLAVLSFAMNYPAKYFSAEDMERLKKTLMPLISVIIAFAPQSSVREMLALYRSGILRIVSVGEDSYISPLEDGGIEYHFKNTDGKREKQKYETFIDCIGQPHLKFEDLPYPGLLNGETLNRATLKFSDSAIAKSRVAQGDEQIIKVNEDEYRLIVPGVAINDHFQVIGTNGFANDRIYMLAVPFIGGYNPDFSGLDFGEEASKRVAEKLFD